MTKRGEPFNLLTEALRATRTSVSEVAFPLQVSSAEPARAEATALLAHIDDYVLPRLSRLDAPLLVVIGGPTGAGKSTMVNSLVRAPASAAGVLRPTTRAPVLVCHPSDAAWFRSGDLLAGMARTNAPVATPDQLQLVTAPALAPGCAFLDTPDIDSVVTAHRDITASLLAAADMWLFVTTANRYADRAAWDVLRSAQQRGAAVAMLLNRVVGEAASEVTAHLSEMLAAHDLADMRLFVIPETMVDGQSLLPEAAVRPVREWFDELAGDQQARAEVVHVTLDGALAAIPQQVEWLAAALDDQLAMAEELAEQVGMAFGAARATVERGIYDGTVLSGEVLARWRELLGSDEWARSTRGADRRGGLLGGRTRPGRALITALEEALVRLFRAAIADAVEHAHQAWSRHAAGEALLEVEPDLAVPAAATLGGGDDQVAKLVREWRRESLELVAAETGGRVRNRAAAQVTRAVVLVGAAAATAMDDTEEAEHGQVQAAFAGNQALPVLVGKARDDLLARIAVLIDTEAARYLERLAGASLDSAQVRALRQAATRLAQARRTGGLAPGAPGVDSEATGPDLDTQGTDREPDQ